MMATSLRSISMLLIAYCRFILCANFKYRLEYLLDNTWNDLDMVHTPIPTDYVAVLKAPALTYGVLYKFRAMAYSAAGPSVYSNEISQVIVATPNKPVITAVNALLNGSFVSTSVFWDSDMSATSCIHHHTILFCYYYFLFDVCEKWC